VNYKISPASVIPGVIGAVAIAAVITLLLVVVVHFIRKYW